MAEFQIPNPGEICWRELRTHDLDAVAPFYSQLFGWELKQTNMSTMPYKEIILNGTAIGGMMPMGDEWQGQPSHWASYIAVANADETVEKIKAEGGNVQMGPFDAPGIGRMAMVTDPSGAEFAIIQFEQPA